MVAELDLEYEEYLTRFHDAIGELAVGGFAKHNGQLIKKLSFDEFRPLFDEYTGLVRSYVESLDRGDTINDLIVKLLRERATKLVLPNPA